MKFYLLFTFDENTKEKKYFKWEWNPGSKLAKMIGAVTTGQSVCIENTERKKCRKKKCRKK